MRFKRLIHIFFCAVLTIAGNALHAQPTLEGDIVVDTLGEVKYVQRHHPFKDSILNDTIKAAMHKVFQLDLPTTKTKRNRDPFDPFLHNAFIRVGLGRFWFFIVSVLVIGLFVYYRNAFPKQFNQRLKGITNPYYFKELLSDFGLSFTSGSILAAIFSNLVLSQLIVSLVLYSRFVNLNNIVFFIFVLIGVFLWKGILFLLQGLQAYVLDISDLARKHTQTHINFDLLMAMVTFPIINLIYFNASALQGFPTGIWLGLLFICWISGRIAIEFLNMIRERGLSLSGILYFCAFEILPHAVLITMLLRTYTS